MDFPGGATVSLTMSAFTPLEHRKTGCSGHTVTRRATASRCASWTSAPAPKIVTGIGAAERRRPTARGGDSGLMSAFLDALAG